MTISFGAPCFVNTAPLLFALKNKIIDHPFHFTFDFPVQINALFSEKKLCCGLISTAEWFTNPSVMTLPFGIGAKNSCKSVLLFLRKETPISKIKRITLSPHSKTSNLLVKILCAHFWQIKPQFLTTLHEQCDAIIVIGDQCLSMATPAGFRAIDLAAEWFSYTKKSFVFAIVATHNPESRDFLSQTLDSSLQWGVKNLDTLCRSLETKTLSYSVLFDYFSQLNYRLEEDHFEGLKLFQTLSGKLL